MARIQLTQFQHLVDTLGNQPIFIGIDVHKNSYAIALYRDDGVAHTFVAPASPSDLIALLSKNRIPVALIVYEAGPTGFILARALQKAKYPVAVVAPSRMPRAVAPGAKSDRLDCLKLAQYAAKGMLKPIAIPTATQEADRALVRRRLDLAEDIRRVKQRIKSLLLCQNIPEPAGLEHWSLVSQASLKHLVLPDSLRMTLDSLLRELEYLTKEKGIVEKHIAGLAKSQELGQVMECLQTVPGVGLIVAAAFACELFSPERFTRSEEVTSYLGLAPMARQSGESRGRSRICPVGQTRLRSLLVEATWRWLSSDPERRLWFQKVRMRSGILQKALVAAARKLAVLLWRLSVEKRAYRPAEMVVSSA